MSGRLGRLAGVAVGSLCFAALVAAAASGSVRGGGNGNDNQDRQVLEGTKPTWTAAVPKAADVPAGEGIQAKVWLAPNNAAQLDALARAVSDPANAQYRQFISADQYRAQFAPTQAQVAQVSTWLTSAGLSVDSVGPDAHFLAVSGPAAAVNAAFGTQLAKYVVNGKLAQAPAADVSVPKALAGVVEAVTGLSTVGHQVQPADLGSPPAFVNSTQCSTFYGRQLATTLPKFQGATLPYAVCGYTPSQYRSAYGVDRAGSSGRGQTVAITDAFDSSALLGDANTYATRHGDPAFGRNQFRDLSVPENAAKASDCGGNGWYGEQTLDIEAVHGMAPGANVHYYGAASCFDDDLLASLARIVSDNKASIVTNSWGEPTFVVINGVRYITIDQNLINAYEHVFKQGAVQGIGFYFSSGDSGDDLDAWGYAHPDWPTGDPWVTSVGGTSLAVGRDGNRQFETGWGTQRYNLNSAGTDWALTVPFLYGAGGGFSQIFAQPWYQTGVTPGTGRAVPDIAMDGDPTTGMLVGETQTFPLASRFGPPGVHYGEYRIGGTSVSSPLLAGAQAAGQQEGERIGFANPLIYSLFKRGHGVFYDVTPQGDAGNVRADYRNGSNADGGTNYTVRTFNHDSSLTTGPGWDDVTGVGSITAKYLAALSDRNNEH